MTDHKQGKLREILKSYESVAVAFSGGVDSSLLIHEASKILRNKLVAVTVISDLLPESELEEAIGFAKEYGIEHRLVEIDILSNEDFRKNPINRCYICKKEILSLISSVAEEYGINNIAHGANMDDLDDYRPGMKAANEFGIKAPFIDAGFTKKDIRQLSLKEELKTFDKPEMACLASRIPTNNLITKEKLKRIELSEEFLKNKGFKKYRVRHLYDTASIELSMDELAKLLDENSRMDIVEKFKNLGFKNVTLDLEGYKKGGMNILEYK